MILKWKTKWNKFKKNADVIFGKYIAPVILFLYPFLGIGKGVDYTDSMYSPANFMFFTEQNNMWNFATYLANAIGFLFSKLPFGDTYLGMQIYTTLLVSIMAVGAFLFFKKKIPAIVAFFAEFLAIGLCWCPTTILYNYLTYFFLLGGTLLFYEGVISGKKNYLIGGGVLLGMNVLVRFPNLTHMALIVALWYYGIFKKRKLGKIVTDTLWCVLGYAIGIGSVLGVICVQYGFSEYVEAINGLFTMSETASGYKPLEMLLTLKGVFMNNLNWILVVYIVVVAGTLFWIIAGFSFEWFMFRKGIIGVGIAAMIFYFYHAGMFDFKYNYTYTSIYQWCVVWFVFSAILMIALLFTKRIKLEDKVIAVIALISMAILPLGSNTNIFPIINNLFWIAGASLLLFYKWCKGAGGKHYFTAVKMVYIAVFTMVLVQSVGFKMNFEFRDGYATDGITKENMDTKIENNGILKGMYTTAWKQEVIDGLTLFMEEENLNGNGQKLITYGNIPGVHYFLQMEPAISTAWADLDSYTLMEEDLEAVEGQPVVIVSALVQACLAGDEEALEYHKTHLEQGEVSVEKTLESEKLSLLKNYIEKNQYEIIYQNEKFVVYQ